MNRRDKTKPPRPDMLWSKKHKMWVDQDVRTPDRKDRDEKLIRVVEADQERIN
jgi:hypothetical protein